MSHRAENGSVCHCALWSYPVESSVAEQQVQPPSMGERRTWHRSRRGRRSRQTLNMHAGSSLQLSDTMTKNRVCTQYNQAAATGADLKQKDPLN